MEVDLTNNGKIYLLLLNKIHEPYICDYIIHLKKEQEEKESYHYHSERWNDIVLSYFKCLKTRYPTYSYILNGKDYISNSDKNLEFFNKTGISYQVRELVMTLINEYNEEDISEKEKKEWRKEDDIIYGKLAKRIMNKMR
tara:strand:+ start:3775 stop:4194 length:420 start_codon:yes stop_codon:yes gene_type:complete